MMNDLSQTTSLEPSAEAQWAAFTPLATAEDYIASLTGPRPRRVSARRAYSRAS